MNKTRALRAAEKELFEVGCNYAERFSGILIDLALIYPETTEDLASEAMCIFLRRASRRMKLSPVKLRRYGLWAVKKNVRRIVLNSLITHARPRPMVIVHPQRFGDVEADVLHRLMWNKIDQMLVNGDEQNKEIFLRRFLLEENLATIRREMDLDAHSLRVALTRMRMRLWRGLRYTRF